MLLSPAVAGEGCVLPLQAWKTRQKQEEGRRKAALGGVGQHPRQGADLVQTTLTGRQRRLSLFLPPPAHDKGLRQLSTELEVILRTGGS